MVCGSKLGRPCHHFLLKKNTLPGQSGASFYIGFAISVPAFFVAVAGEKLLFFCEKEGNKTTTWWSGKRMERSAHLAKCTDLQTNCGMLDEL
jgi:hypothetical protein